MANQTFLHANPVGSQPLQAGTMEENVFSIWANLQRHPLYPEYRNRVQAYLSVHDTAFAHYAALLTDPLAFQFIEAVSLSTRLLPPINMWNEIIKLRCHRNFASVRSIIVADIDKQPLNQRRSPKSARSSDASYRSLAHLSTQSGNSSRSSRVSSNTDSFVHFEIDDDVGQQSNLAISATSEKEHVQFPDPPPIVTSTRGQRRAPKGKCFVCPSKECQGKHFFPRVGDWTNHIERVHKVTAWHDPRRFLRDDPRCLPAAQEVKTEAPEEAAAMLRSDVDINNESEVAVTCPPKTPSSQLARNDNVKFQRDAPTQVNTMMPPAGHYGNTGVEPLDEDILYQQYLEDQGPSWSDHDDTMQH